MSSWVHVRGYVSTCLRPKVTNTPCGSEGRIVVKVHKDGLEYHCTLHGDLRDCGDDFVINIERWFRNNFQHNFVDHGVIVISSPNITKSIVYSPLNDQWNSHTLRKD